MPKEYSERSPGPGPADANEAPVDRLPGRYVDETDETWGEDLGDLFSYVDEEESAGQTGDSANVDPNGPFANLPDRVDVGALPADRTAQGDDTVAAKPKQPIDLELVEPGDIFDEGESVSSKPPILEQDDNGEWVEVNDPDTKDGSDTDAAPVDSPTDLAGPDAKVSTEPTPKTKTPKTKTPEAKKAPSAEESLYQLWVTLDRYMDQVADKDTKTPIDTTKLLELFVQEYGYDVSPQVKALVKFIDTGEITPAAAADLTAIIQYTLNDLGPDFLSKSAPEGVKTDQLTKMVGQTLVERHNAYRAGGPYADKVEDLPKDYQDVRGFILALTHDVLLGTNDMDAAPEEDIAAMAEFFESDEKIAGVNGSWREIVVWDNPGNNDPIKRVVGYEWEAWTPERMNKNDMEALKAQAPHDGIEGFMEATAQYIMQRAKDNSGYPSNLEVLKSNNPALNAAELTEQLYKENGELSPLEGRLLDIVSGKVNGRTIRDISLRVVMLGLSRLEPSDLVLGNSSVSNLQERSQVVKLIKSRFEQALMEEAGATFVNVQLGPGLYRQQVREDVFNVVEQLLAPHPASKVVGPHESQAIATNEAYAGKLEKLEIEREAISLANEMPNKDIVNQLGRAGIKRLHDVLATSGESRASLYELLGLYSDAAEQYLDADPTLELNDASSTAILSQIIEDKLPIDAPANAMDVIKGNVDESGRDEEAQKLVDYLRFVVLSESLKEELIPESADSTAFLEARLSLDIEAERKRNERQAEARKVEGLKKAADAANTPPKAATSGKEKGPSDESRSGRFRKRLGAMMLGNRSSAGTSASKRAASGKDDARNRGGGIPRV